MSILSLVIFNFHIIPCYYSKRWGWSPTPHFEQPFCIYLPNDHTFSVSHNSTGYGQSSYT